MSPIKDITDDLEYWRRILAGRCDWGDGCADAERPPDVARRDASVDIVFDDALAARLSHVTKGAPLLVYAAIVASLQIVLSHYIGRRRISIGSPPRRDDATQAAVVPIVEAVTPGRSFRDLLGGVRQKLLDGYAHQRPPAPRLIDALGLGGIQDRCPLFAVAAVLEDLHAPLPEVHPDLVVRVSAHGSTWAGRIEYPAALYRRAAVERLARHLLWTLAFGLTHPDAEAADIPLIEPGAPERSRPSATATVDDVMPLSHQMIAATARRCPGVLAVEAPDATLTYAELDRRAERLAMALVVEGVRRESLVGVCVRPGAGVIAAMLAVLEAGGAFVPIDPADPEDRIRTIAASLVLTLVDRESSHRFPTGLRVRVLEDLVGDAPTAPVELPHVDADNPAYVIHTSGSTGQPKGVVVLHRGLANLARVQPETLGIVPGTRVLQHASLSFDASVWEIFPTLAAGATVCVAPPEEVAPGLPLLRTLQARRINVLTIPPSSLAMLGPGDALPDLRLIVTAGEACPQRLAAAWRDRLRFVNAYGPTEATVCATFADVEEAAFRPPIGRALPGVDVHVLDDRLQPVAAGMLGGIYVGGVSLARGYLHRPDLTAMAFLPNPFAAAPGARLYRTGDVGRILDDGQIDFRGRADSQTKVRGFRVEVEEIEEHLRAHPAVAQAGVAAVGEGERRRLIACVVLAERARTTAGELAGFLAGRLPAYLVPSRIVPVAELPRTRSGKIDRRALGDVHSRDPAASFGAGVPSLIYDLVANSWRESLGVGAPRPDDHFFQLGGTSLVAIRVVGDLNRLFGVDLPVRAIFETPTLSEYVYRIAAALDGSDVRQELPISAAPLDGLLPLSREQQHFWLLDQLDPTSGAYNVSGAVRLRGGLRVAALRAGLDTIVARHHALRTVIVESNGGPAQRVVPCDAAPFTHVDLSALVTSARAAAAHRIGSDAAHAPFDLTRAPLLRAVLLQLSDDDHVLAIALHHIVFDAWSMRIVLEELSACYAAFCRGAAADLPEVAIQHTDYAWSQQRAGDARVERDLAFWAAYLAGVREPTLPVSRRAATANLSGADTVTQTLSPGTTEALERAARAATATAFMMCATAVAAVLREHTGSDDVLLGTPVANRSRPELARAVGLFVNTVVLRISATGASTFRTLLDRVRSAALAALAHADAPYDRVAGQFGGRRAGIGAPLFSALVNLVDVPYAAMSLEGLIAESFPLRQRPPKVDLELTVERHDSGLSLSLTYDRAAFIRRAAEGLLAEVCAWLERASISLDTDLLTSGSLVASGIDQFPFERGA